MPSTLLDHITAAVADEYTVLGQLGESPRGSAFLAQELAGGQLVGLAVPPSADELSVLAAVGDEVPANAGTCTACGEAPPTFTAFCPNCGRAFVRSAVGVHRFTPDEVRAATAPAYEFVGEIAHQSGGSLFFVRDQVDRRLVGLSGQPTPGGGQALEAVWVALRGDRAPPSVESPYASAPVPEPDPYAYAATSSPGAPAVDVAGALGEPPYTYDSPPGYPPDYVGGADATGESEPMPSRRRWVPVAIGAAVVLAAGGAWAAMRGGHDTPPAVQTPIGPATPEAALPPDGPSATNEGSGGAGTAPSETSPGVALTPPVSGGRAEPGPGPGPAPIPSTPPPVSPVGPPDAGRVTERPPVRGEAFIQLDGSALPAGWSWTVNGRRGPASLTARIPAYRPAVLTIDAPGYCPETLQVDAPTPGGVQRWAPRLRGKPMVGEC